MDGQFAFSAKPARYLVGYRNLRFLRSDIREVPWGPGDRFAMNHSSRLRHPCSILLFAGARALYRRSFCSGRVTRRCSSGSDESNSSHASG